MKIITDVDQGTPEWLKLRAGSVGGTAIGMIAAGGKGKSRKTALYQLASEVITGIPTENFKFQHADRGHEFEPAARENWEFANGVEAKQVAMVKADEPHRHYSPDGLVGDDGMIEIKVRIPSVYVEAYNEGHYPVQVRRQIRWGLYICEREWCDYCQHCPEMEGTGVPSMIVKRIYREESKIKALAEIADKFINEMLRLVERMKNGTG